MAQSIKSALPLNSRDRLMWQCFLQGIISLDNLEVHNEPEYFGWISRRQRIANALVWEFNWFVTSGNVLLRFPRRDVSCYPIEAFYLPGASVRCCREDEECSAKLSFVIEIIACLHILHNDVENVVASGAPRAVYFSFESADEMYRGITFFAKIAARHSWTAAVTFGLPTSKDHRIHLYATRGDDNFGEELLSEAMQVWLQRHGVSEAEVKDNEAVLVSCARVLSEYQQRHGLPPCDPPPLPLPEEEVTEDSKPILDTKSTLSVQNLMSVTLESLLTEGNPESLYSNWVRLDSGSQGEVFKAVRNSDGLTVAIKRIAMSKDKRERQGYIHEIALLKTLRHPNIVTLYDCYQKERNLYIVMEFLDGGKLTHILAPTGGKAVVLTESQLATIMREVLRALQCLHSVKCMHRDVKSDNVLISSNGDVKLADFGFATAILSPKEKRKTVVGTPYWMSPEVARGAPYTFSADVWSAGILFIELCDGLPPLMGLNPMRAMLKICTGPPPTLSKIKKRSSLCTGFLSFLLVKDPSRRPTVERALHHPFIETKTENSCGFLKALLKKASTPPPTKS